MGAKAKPKSKKRKTLSQPQPQLQPKAKPHHHQQQQQQHQTPTVPFHPHDRILLVGEGDLSFARALHANHRCRHILPTTFDTRADVLSKYPQAAEAIAYLEGEGVRVQYGVDATRLGRGGGGGGREVREGWKGMERQRTEEGVEGGEREGEDEGTGELEKKRDGEDIRKGRGAGWDKIVFNFPHVGGKTKDVNRQVRYNQGPSPSPSLRQPLPFPPL